MAGKSEIDVAIVGGGISGVYCAWRLKQAHPDARIVVYEASDHVGGRLLSVRPPDIPNMVAELGGMRILPKTQPLIAALIAELNDQLPGKDKIETYDFPVDEPQNIAYLRGVHLRLADFTARPDKVPYQLSFLERGSSAGAIILNAIQQIVPGITDDGVTEEDRREMARNATFAGRPLWEQGFWNVLMRVISGEAYLLGLDAGGYNTTLSNWNASDAIPWFLSDFGIDPDYKGFKNGFQQVPKTVARLFEKSGGTIQLNATLEGFEWKDGQFELIVNKATARAGKLILAMPRRSLDLLAPASPLLRGDAVQALVRSVTPRPLFKLFTTYSDPWWRAAGHSGPDGKFVPVESGRTVTDLPVRQTYYWPTDQGEPATKGPSMLMASYDDGTNIGFWDGLRPRRGEAWQKGREVSKPAEPFVGEGGRRRRTPWHRYEASAPMVAEIARQLVMIHGLEFSPRVRNAAFRDWGDDPFGGGWNSWNIGVESWKVKTAITEPIAGCPLYICGEAYSDAQGWVEGALQTADMVLAKPGLRSR